MSISVGIDFGTARSGYSYTCGDSAVHVRQRWPGKSGVCYCKTLTALLYQRCGRQYEVMAWGWEALEHYKQLQQAELKGWVYVSQFKLLLADHDQYSSAPPAAELPPGKGAGDVIADFLRCLMETALEEIDMALEYPDHGALQWVLTVPAGWSPEALQTMREAAVSARIIPSEHCERLAFVFEPEAAAVNTLNSHASLGLAEGETLVVVDAGGGTIDITAHKVCASKGSGWALEEASMRLGLLKGAVFLDSTFEKYLGDLLGPGAYQAWAESHPQERLRLIHTKWEEQKMSFNGDNAATIELAWSKPLLKLFKDAGLHEVADEGELRLEAETMRELFSPVVSKIIRSLLHFLDNLPGRCDHVVLVGGFGESQHFLKQLRAALTSYGCTITSPSVPSQAVLAGAALCGQNPTVIASRRTVFAYGLEATAKWSPEHDLERRFFHKGKREYVVGSVFAKMVSANEEFKVDQVVTRDVKPNNAHQRGLELKVFISRNNEARYVDEPGMRLLGKVELLFADRKTITEPESYKVQVAFRFGTTELKVTAKDVQTGQAVAAELRLESSSLGGGA